MKAKRCASGKFHGNQVPPCEWRVYIPWNSERPPLGWCPGVSLANLLMIGEGGRRFLVTLTPNSDGKQFVFRFRRTLRPVLRLVSIVFDHDKNRHFLQRLAVIFFQRSLILNRKVKAHRPDTPAD